MPPKWGEMIRLGASVEENARATLEDIMGTPNGAANHKPSRPDIQKMRDVWNLYNSAADSSLTGDRDQEEFLKAKQEWKEKYELNDQESELVRHYQRLIQEMGMDPNKAFDQIAYSLAKHGGWYQEGSGISAFPEVVDDEQAAKKLLGGALKKYEQQGWPRLFEVISRALDDAYRRDPSSYKLWPWMVKQIKASYDAWLKYGNSRTNFDYEQRLWGQLGAAHIVDITTEGGALLSKLRAENKIPQNFDINQMNVGDFEDWLMEWKRNNVESETQGEVVYEFHNGWSIQKLTTPEQLQYEGDEMGHCVGGYSHAAGSGEVIIYSLRDDKGKPHVTMEIEGIDAGEGYWHPENERDKRQDDNHTFQIVQIQGQGNRTPKPEYQHMIKEFLDSLREKGWKFKRSESWYGNWDEDGNEEEEEYGEYIRDAQELNDWWEDHYQPNYQRYRQAEEKQDAYGLPLNSTRTRPGVSDWSDVIKSVVGSLVDEYDPGRYRGRWDESAQQVYHAWVTDMYADHPDGQQLAKEKESLESEIQSAEEELWEWESNNEYYAMQDSYAKGEVVDKCLEHLQKEGTLPEFLEQLKRLDMDAVEEEGEFWEPDKDQAYDLLEEEHEDLLADVRHEEVNRYYSENARKFLNYLYLLVNKNGMVGPNDLPDPNQRNGGLPSYEDLEKLPWKSEGDQESIDIPGTLSSVHWGIVDIGKCARCGNPIGADGYCMVCGQYNDEFGRPQRVPRGVPQPPQQQSPWQPVQQPTEQIPGAFARVAMPTDQSLLDQIQFQIGEQGWFGDYPNKGWVIRAFLNGQMIGLLATDPDGEIGNVEVNSEYRRKGVATEMLRRLREAGKPAYHSTSLSEDGEAWAERVASEDIQIYPIDEEHNLWFNEHGGENPRYEPEWIRNPETGKMEQTGPMRDTFLDNKGRQGQGYVAYHGERPVASLTYVDDPAGWYMLGSAYTHPDYREQGLFNRLVQPLRDTGKPIDAYVWNNPWLKQKVRGWQMPKTSNAWEDAHRENPPGPPQVHWVPISNDFTQEYSYPDATDYGLPFLYDWGTNTTWLGDAPFFHDDIHDADWDEEKQEHRWGIPYGASHGRYNHLQHMPSEGYTYFWNRLHPDTRAAIEQEIKKVYPHMELPYDGDEFEGEPGEERTLGDAWDEVLG